MSLSAEAVNKIERDAMNTADSDENPCAFDTAQEVILPLVADLRAARAETVERVEQTFAVAEQLHVVQHELERARAENEKLRDALEEYTIGCFMCGGTGIVIRPPKYDSVTCRECENARSALAAAVGLEEDTEATKMNQRKGAIT